MIAVSKVLFCRRYRAALLDYLLGHGETALARAHDLGRRAMEDGLGLLEILLAHQHAINAILESMPMHSMRDSVNALKAAEDFLIETLSPFEMTHRGYLALLKRRQDEQSDTPSHVGAISRT